MVELNPKELKNEARQRLSSTGCDHRKIVLIYSGVTVALMLASGLIQLYLDRQISGTGGLGGLGMRSILQTVESVLDYVNMFFGPFWSAGILSVVIGIVQGDQPQPGNLLDGFRRFGRLLSYLLLETCITVLVATAVCYLSSYVFMFTSWGSTFSEALAPLVENGTLLAAEGTVNMAAIPADTLLSAAIPMCLIFLVLFIPVYAFISYSMRMGRFLLMADQRFRSFSALAYSIQYMKGHKLKMLKLDLSYWWYYLLVGAASVVGYLDVILSEVGIALPFSTETAYMVTLVLYGVLTIALDLWMRMQVDTTFVLAFQKIRSSAAPLPGNNENG